MEFFAYENARHLVVYSAFVCVLCLSIFGYLYLIATGVRWIIRFVKKCIGKKTITEEGTSNE